MYTVKKRIYGKSMAVARGQPRNPALVEISTQASGRVERRFWDERSRNHKTLSATCSDPTPLARSVGASAHREVCHHRRIAFCPGSSVMIDDPTSFAGATACMCVDHRVVRSCTETASRDSKYSRRAGFHDDDDLILLRTSCSSSECSES